MTLLDVHDLVDALSGFSPFSNYIDPISRDVIAARRRTLQPGYAHLQCVGTVAQRRCSEQEDIVDTHCSVGIEIGLGTVINRESENSDAWRQRSRTTQVMFPTP